MKVLLDSLTIQVQSQGFLLAVGCNDGNTTLMEFSESLTNCNRYATESNLDHSYNHRNEKAATSEMFERETRREKILEALNLNKETALKQKSKGLLSLAKGAKGRKQKYSLGDRKETPIDDNTSVTYDPLAKAEKDFYRIIKEVNI